jgi:hypothetical protein
MKTVKPILYMVFGLITLLVFSCLIGNLYTYVHRDDWKSRTTPLPRGTIAILCKNFELEEDHPLCSGEKDVYGPDFYDLIRDTFRPSEEYHSKKDRPATYDDVEKRIGVFKYICESVVYEVSWDRKYFICHYDLRGDGEFLIGILYYYPEMTVFSIATPMGYD